MRNISLRWRIFLCFCGLILIFLIITNVLIYQIKKDIVVDKISTAKTIARTLAFPACEGMSVGKLDSINSIIDLLKSSYKKDIISITIFNNKRKIIAETLRIEYEKLKGLIYGNDDIKVLDTKSIIYAFLPIKVDSYLCGYILISFSKDTIIKDTKDLYKGILFAFLLFISIAVIIYLQMTKFFTKPLIALNKGIKEMNNGNYGISIPVNSSDEIGNLSSTFNIMSRTIKEKINTIEKMNIELKDMYNKAIHDGLTGLYNKSFFLNKIQEYIDNNQYFGLILFDIDHFKKVNDTYGHIAGDYVLKKISEKISLEFSDSFTARYGGEEFALIHTENNLKLISEALREKIENFSIKYKDKDLSITVSCGCAVFPEDGNLVIEIIENADKALYHAKQNGRNRVFCYSEIKNECR